jgi:hypothetical protein
MKSVALGGGETASTMNSTIESARFEFESDPLFLRRLGRARNVRQTFTLPVHDIVAGDGIAAGLSDDVDAIAVHAGHLILLEAIVVAPAMDGLVDLEAIAQRIVPAVFRMT